MSQVINGIYLCSTATAGDEGLNNAEAISISSVVGGIFGTLIIVSLDGMC